MGVFSGKDGSMTWAGGAVARVRDWSFEGSFDTLDITNLGQIAREYYPGLKGASGSATIFYHDDNATLSSILDNCLTTGLPSSAALELKWGTKKIACTAYVNTVSTACSTGEVMTAQVSFTMTGDYSVLTL